LQVNTALQVLHFNRNKIGGKGAAEMAKALQVNTSLQELYLYHNNIGDDAAVEL
jgi:Ran GTPase-activating protein (RanGAP) involved in mRNA processing and transport